MLAFLRRRVCTLLLLAALAYSPMAVYRLQLDSDKVLSCKTWRGTEVPGSPIAKNCIQTGAWQPTKSQNVTQAQVSYPATRLLPHRLYFVKVVVFVLAAVCVLALSCIVSKNDELMQRVNKLALSESRADNDAQFCALAKEIHSRLQRPIAFSRYWVVIACTQFVSIVSLIASYLLTTELLELPIIWPYQLVESLLYGKGVGDFDRLFPAMVDCIEIVELIVKGKFKRTLLYCHIQTWTIDTFFTATMQYVELILLIVFTCRLLTNLIQGLRFISSAKQLETILFFEHLETQIGDEFHKYVKGVVENLPSGSKP